MSGLVPSTANSATGDSAGSSSRSGRKKGIRHGKAGSSKTGGEECANSGGGGSGVSFVLRNKQHAARPRRRLTEEQVHYFWFLILQSTRSINKESQQAQRSLCPTQDQNAGHQLEWGGQESSYSMTTGESKKWLSVLEREKQLGMCTRRDTDEIIDIDELYTCLCTCCPFYYIHLWIVRSCNCEKGGLPPQERDTTTNIYIYFICYRGAEIYCIAPHCSYPFIIFLNQLKETGGWKKCGAFLPLTKCSQVWPRYEVFFYSPPLLLCSQPPAIYVWAANACVSIAPAHEMTIHPLEAGRAYVPMANASIPPPVLRLYPVHRVCHSVL